MPMLAGAKRAGVGGRDRAGLALGCYRAARDSKQKTPTQERARVICPLICEALAGRYDMSSCDLGWVRKQRLEIRVHELPGPFR